MKIRALIKSLLMIGECWTIIILTWIITLQVLGVKDLVLVQVIIGVAYILFCEKICTYKGCDIKDGKKD